MNSVDWPHVAMRGLRREFLGNRLFIPVSDPFHIKLRFALVGFS